MVCWEQDRKKQSPPLPYTHHNCVNTASLHPSWGLPPSPSMHCPCSSLGLWCDRNCGEAGLPSFWAGFLTSFSWNSWWFFIMINYPILVLSHPSLSRYLWAATVILCVWPTFPLLCHSEIAQACEFCPHPSKPHGRFNKKSVKGTEVFSIAWC